MTLRGSVEAFPLETILQLLAATGKTGQLEVRSDTQMGSLGLAEGRLISAVAGDDSGEPALGAIFSVERGDFEFVAWNEAPQANLSGDLNQLLDRAVEERDRLVAIRRVIPDDRIRFRLSERAADQGEIRMAPEQWRALLAVNGERDVKGIAQHLRLGRLVALGILSELVKGGLVDTMDAPPQPSGTSGGAGAGGSAAGRIEPAAPPPASADREPASAAPAEPRRHNLADALDERLSAFDSAPAAEPPLADTPLDAPTRQADDRLSALAGVFGPAEPAPPASTWGPPSTMEQRADASWQQPEPSWPAAAPTEEPPSEELDPRLASLRTPVAEPAPRWGQPAVDTAEPEVDSVEPAEAEPALEKKKGGLFGFLKREQPAAEPAGATTLIDRGAGTPVGQIAAFSNALLAEYNSGRYGKAQIEDRMANLMMRVDEQADPIDRPLPVVEDRIDVAALEHESIPDYQALPYLAILVSQIYDDAERAFGKDKAKRGYRVAQQYVFAGDTSLLDGPELAGRLPKA